MSDVECTDIYVAVGRNFCCFIGGVEVKQLINGGNNFTSRDGAGYNRWRTDGFD